MQENVGYRSIVESLNAIPWRLSLATKQFTYVGPQVERILGVPPGSIVDIDSWAECIHPDDRQRALSFSIEATQRGEDHEFEYRAVRPDGKIVRIKNVVTVLAESGIPTELTGIMLDVSEVKPVDQVPCDSEAMLRAVLESSPVCNKLVSPDSKLLYMSGMGVKALKIADIHSYYGKPYPLEEWPEFICEPLKEHLDRAIGGEACSVEAPVLDTDENMIWFYHNFEPVFDDKGHVKYVVAASISVSKRRRAEQELRDSETRLRAVLESSPVGIELISLDSKLLYMSPAGVENLKIPDIELFYGSSYPPAFYSEEMRKPLVEGLAKTMAGEEVVIECPVIDTEGNEIWHLTRFVPARDEVGEIKYVVGASIDITKRKQVEQERKELEAKLCRVHKMEAIGTLAGGIAHDFNNILGAILGYSEMAMEDSPEGSRVRAHMEQILKAASRAKDLVRQILTFSRRGESEAKAVQINRVVEETVELLRASLPSTIEIREALGVEPGCVWADPTQIHQVVMNLCTNASDAMREEGGVLEVRVGEVEVDSERAAGNPNLESGNYVTLSISDGGHGMDEETKARIFEPFFTTKDVGEGTGLGLATVHGIVIGLGGDIAVESEPQKGTTLHVFLPRTGADATSAASELEPAPGGNERILLVDDEAALTEMGQESLEHLGYSVSSWTTSVGALEAFRTHPDQFDLVITDQTMPTMSGMGLAGELIRIRSGIPIILVTGFSETIRPEDAFAIGIREYLMKPVPGHELARVVRRVLDEERSAEA